MSVIIGIVLAFFIGGSATAIGLDRDRAMYPLVMIVIALYYVLFAVMGGSTEVLVLELAVAAAFIALALAGFKSTLWIVVAALAAHGVFDLAHPHIYANPAVPVWWPPFCGAYDVAAAAYLGWLIAKRNVEARPAARDRA